MRDDRYIVVQPDATVLQHDGTFGHIAEVFTTVADARAAFPKDAIRPRVIFASQLRKFKRCGCI